MNKKRVLAVGGILVVVLLATGAAFVGGQLLNGQQPTLKVQQVVEPGSLDDIGQFTDITVWGNETGDRIVADVLVYMPPPVLQARQFG